MSTYTDLHIRKKENLTILRMPGNPYDGMTPQRVIFANPENIYNGKFIGELSTTSVSFNNVTMTNCDIIGGMLSNVELKYGDQTIALTELTTNISQNTENITNLQKFQTSAETSCKIFSENIGQLNISVEQLSSYTNELSNKINSLSSQISSTLSSIDELTTNISSLSNDFINYTNSNDKTISALSDDLYELSNKYDSYVKSNDDAIDTLSDNISTLSNAIDDVSNNLETSSNILDEKIETLKKQIHGGVVYRQALSIDYIGQSYEHTLPALLSVNGIANNEPLSIGYFYVTQTRLENRICCFIYDNVKLTHGDWLIIKENCYAGTITSNDIDVVDAQDYDNFKLHDDNVATGNNTFTGQMTFAGNAKFDGTIAINNYISVDSNIDVNGQISSTSLIVDNADIKNLTVDLANVKYNETSSLCDLSNDFQQQINDVTSNIDNLSIELNQTSSTLLSNISYLSSELSDYHNTLSGIDRLNHEQGDISSDNLIVTDLLASNIDGQSHHNRYYMTFLSGTIVLRPIK